MMDRYLKGRVIAALRRAHLIPSCSFASLVDTGLAVALLTVARYQCNVYEIETLEKDKHAW